MALDRAEVKQHVQDMARILSEPAFGDALGDLTEDEAAGGKMAVAEAQRDPHAFFQKRGVKHIPPGAKITVTTASPLTLTICLNSWCGSYTW